MKDLRFLFTRTIINALIILGISLGVWLVASGLGMNLGWESITVGSGLFTITVGIKLAEESLR